MSSLLLIGVVKHGNIATYQQSTTSKLYEPDFITCRPELQTPITNVREIPATVFRCIFDRVKWPFHFRDRQDSSDITKHAFTSIANKLLSYNMFYYVTM